VPRFNLVATSSSVGQLTLDLIMLVIMILIAVELFTWGFRTRSQSKDERMASRPRWLLPLAGVLVLAFIVRVAIVG
jgi:hypothetical protein